MLLIIALAIPLVLQAHASVAAQLHSSPIPPDATSLHLTASALLSAAHGPFHMCHCTGVILVTEMDVSLVHVTCAEVLPSERECR